MPKKTKYPGLRSHAWKTAGGEVRVAYYYDMRGTGKPDQALGTDFAAAVVEWDKIRNKQPRIAGTIEEAFERWEREKLPLYKSATTRRNYKQNLRTMRPVFGPATWASIRVSTIADYLRTRSAKIQANREKALLSVIWGCAREWDMTALPFPAYKMRMKNKERAVEVDWTDQMFAALYVHAEPFLRDAMDIISASGWRVRDVLKAQLTDVRGGWLKFDANKTGKRGDVQLDDPERPVIAGVISRRRAMKAPHIFLLARGDMIVTERMLTDAFARARAKAMVECPEVATLKLRYVRKYAGQLCGSLAEAQQLLQHGSGATTRAHYRPVEKLRPSR